MRRLKIFRVVKEGERWAVRPEHEEAIASFETRAEAKEYAKQVAKSTELSRVYLENDAHAIEREMTFGWTQAAPPSERLAH